MMDVSPGKIEFDHLGIGTVLQRSRLAVPVNQREYAWKKENVLDLFQDLSEAIESGKGAYFLGTIVLVGSKTASSHQVTDGQQRLATVTILIAAIRDYLSKRSDAKYVATSVEQFLHEIDRERNDLAARLTLNVDDNEFFRNRILPPPDDPRRTIPPSKPSHDKIAGAAKEAEDYVKTIIKGHNEKNRVNALNRWVTFIEKSAQVIILYVADDVNAFVMFETLNDRGVKTTQADMLKNYLFGESKERTEEAQSKWSSMKGALESSESDDIVVTFLRHYLVVRHGAIRDKEVYSKIKESVRGPSAAIAFLDELVDQAGVYAALSNHQHAYWHSFGTYSQKLRRHVETLNELNVEQIKPLMLSCLKRFNKPDAAKIFRIFISWAVRFMVGGSPTGAVEKYYAGRAVEVWENKIPTAAKLVEAMKKFLPTDDAFRHAFANARVSKSHLARYYLRSLERTKQQDKEPEWVVNDDAAEVNLEHVLPENPGPGWGNIDKLVAEGVYRRLGNMILLKAKVNSTVGNSSFADKKAAYAKATTQGLSQFVLSAANWGPDEINDRQNELADLAIQTWPLEAK